MIRLALIAIVAAAPLAAQEAPSEPPARSVERLLRDLFSEVEPALRGLRDRIDDLNNYEPPEMLPNGDIILRRKTPLRPPPRPDADPDAPVDL